jgi:electron transfer flavoprotein alpha subunit
VADDERLNEYNTDLYAAAAVQVIKEIKPSIILIGATNQGRDLAPRLASILKTGLVADCTDLGINENGLLEATRPTFGGQLMAVILNKEKPQMASVRPKVFKPLKEKIGKSAEIVCVNPELPQKRVELLDFVEAVKQTACDISNAQVIVAGGVGMKNAQGFELLQELADRLGGAVGATRAAVDKGMTTRDKQIGQTGATVAPKLYIACGISGAAQHVVGMCNSDKIIAINTNANAPIFDICDVGFVGDVFEVVPELIKQLN